MSELYDGYQLNDMTEEQQKSRKESAKIPQGTGVPLFVGNLPFSVDEESLRSIFMECEGPVNCTATTHCLVPILIRPVLLGVASMGSVRLIKDSETGQSKGFGFVEYATDEQANAAIAAIDGRSVDGRTIGVRMGERKGRGGRGGQRSGGQRRGPTGGAGGRPGGPGRPSGRAPRPNSASS